MKNIILLFLIWGALTTPSLGQDETIMLQGYHWLSYQSLNGNSWWVNLDNKTQTFKDDRIDYIWLPPFSDTADNQGFLPRRLTVLDSGYGSETELRAMIGNLQGANITVVADIILNHRVGTTDWADFTNPTWPTTYVCADDEWPGGPKSVNNDEAESLPYARDMDHSLPAMRADYKAWLEWIRDDVGIIHWRLDNSKGYTGGRASEYIQDVGAQFAVGEFFDGNAFALRDFLDSVNHPNARLFDFATRFSLRDAVIDGGYWRLENNGIPAGLMGLRPADAVTFLDNHDFDEDHVDGNGNAVVGDPFPRDTLERAHAYLLTHPGIPCIYYTHLYPHGGFPDNSAKIRELINIRKDQGIHSVSSVSIQRAENNLYAAIIDNRVAMKIGSTNWSPSGSNWSLASSGSQYSVWVNTDNQTVATFVPNPVTAGESIQITYNDGPGSLNNPTAIDLHWGVDGWVNTVDTPMIFNSSTGRWEVTVTVPQTATDAFNAAFINPVTGEVDNNNGSDWHTPVVPGGPVITITPDPVINGQILTVTYNSILGALNSPSAVTMQWGTDAWQNVQQVAMIDTGNSVWEASITVPASATASVNFMFFNPTNSEIDNNNGDDWHAQVLEAQVVTASPDPIGVGQNLTITYNDIPGTLTSPTAVSMQWGTDGWQNVVQTPMSQNTLGLWEVTVAVPASTTTSVDFMFFDPITTDFDNNDGVDWSVNVVFSPVVTVAPDPVTAGQTLTVTYNDVPGALTNPASVNMQWGIDNFQNIVQTPMAKNADGIWEATIAVPGTATSAVDFMFFDPGTSAFDNNSGADWHVDVLVAAVVTTIKIHYDTGFGNSMWVRGNTDPLSWTLGALTTWTAGNIWEIEIEGIPVGETFDFKCLINDTQWENVPGGGNRQINGGQTLDVFPSF